MVINVPRKPPPLKKPRYSKESFILAAQAIHGEFYDYSLVPTIPRLNQKLRFICPIHGNFDQYGCHHLSGSGCKICGILDRSGINAGAHKDKVKRRNDTTLLPYNRRSINCALHGVQVVPQKFRNCPICRASSKRTWKEYKQQVKKETERHWRDRPGFIDPDYEFKRRGRTSFHIDHLYSVRDGFENNISAEIIGHWSNLCLIFWKYNIYKSRKSLRSEESLIESYNDCKKEFPDEI